jgi:hypothetical protein
MFGAYNANGGVEIAPDTSDPYDTSHFPSSKYPYAFEVFGNNGTVPRSSSVTSASNHSLDELTNGSPNAATLYGDILLTGSGSSFTGSDHYPIVGDYEVVVPGTAVPVAPVLQSQGFSNGFYQFKLTSSTNTAFQIQASTNLTTWTNIGSTVTSTNGTAIFQDTNSGNFPYRMYRAYWASP